MVHRVAWSAIVLCVLCVSSSADTPKAASDKLLAEGRQLMSAKDPKAACGKFEAAIRIAASDIPIMLELGRCNEALDKLATAIRWYRQVIFAASENKVPEAETIGKQHTMELSPRIPRVVLEVDAASGVTIEVDRMTIDPLEYRSLELDPGDHELVGHATGKRAVRVTITARSGEEQIVKVAFGEPAVPVYVDRGRGRRIAGVVTGSVGLGLFVATATYGYYEKRRYDDPNTPPDELDDTRARVKYIGTTGFLLSVGLITTGVILYLTAPDKVEVSDGTAIAPIIGDDELGLAVAGRF